MTLNYNMTAERWGVFTVSIEGKADGNPFTDYSLKGRFISSLEDKEVYGFYDGEGLWKINFMPYYTGEYTFVLSGSAIDKEYSGSFTVTEPAVDNHGPVHVANMTHFAYADGTPYYSVGTTCYAWAHQKDEVVAQTLKELSNGWFNKIRFCVFPKHYDYNFCDPVTFPFEGQPVDASGITRENFFTYRPGCEGNAWDFYRPNPKHFQRLEALINELMKLGIEADIILFHPYDRWGFSQMPASADDAYLRYCIARFAAYRNVWWSLANEYDLLPTKSEADWERFGELLHKEDPYNHLRSVHNCKQFYDFSRPWVTHCSCQRIHWYHTTELTTEFLAKWQKPVVWDEICYEGNFPHDWGNITAEELVRRFWEASIRGGYAGHGETYESDDGIVWWSHGGTLHGESQPRIRFLQRILSETPWHGLKTAPMARDCHGIADSLMDMGYHIYYFGFNRPANRFFRMPEGEQYEAEVIDTWNMTVTPVGTYSGSFKIDLPGRQYMAIRLKRV